MSVHHTNVGNIDPTDPERATQNDRGRRAIDRARYASALALDALSQSTESITVRYRRRTRCPPDLSERTK